MLFEKKRRHLERYIDIGKVLARHGWENLLSRIGLAHLFRVRRRETGVPPGPVQVRETLEELGPTFIKLGQVLSTRPEIVPPEYAEELEKLQDKAPEIPVSEVLRVIEEEFGTSVGNLFTSFDETPLAAASLGQTHTAILHDGRKVVIKVQRPDIRQLIENDLEIIAGVSRFLDQHFQNLRIYSLPDLADEFSVTLRQELDYTREGRNGDKLKEIFENIPYVKIAATIWAYTTPRVFNSELIDGIKINNVQTIDASGYDRREIASNISKAYWKMVFVDGFYHADPHPGNIVVLEGNVIGLLDYGMIGYLDSNLKNYVTILVEEYIEQDSSGFAEILLTMGTYPSDLNRKAFEREIDRLLRQYYGAPVREINIGEIFRRAVRISAKHNVRLPASLGLLIKTILGLESIVRVLDPDYDLTAEARQFIERSLRKEFSLSKLRIQAIHSLLYWKWLLLEFPHRISDVLDRMAEGTFRVVFHHEGLEGPIRDIDRSANRLSFALLASATIIASAMILSAQIGPSWRGFSVLGLVGFGVSFIFSLWLVISIIRAGRLW